MKAPNAIDADPELNTFIARIDAAQEEFAHGRPGAFKALWSHTEDVTLSGGLGGVVELGWDKVAARLDWASSNYAEGERSNQVIGGGVEGGLAYLVRKEIIDAKIGGDARSRQELRVTMVFRRGGDGWRIVHRHADSQVSPSSPNTP
jgi:ketosteroid isomerase-like protein